ncbi:hypothetical protein ASPZODRAFT_166742 [Penicilliopsis zonata CBS 506.65]|uniref:Major facilitator superfamily (MFS) profile domain-containing protein n=1 Tax=Penicilliopsis zonata CBS 506.65 TaxID=1073090 RepID=A0A1L9SH61_9EURO|nr:hypothetical protein ASPZODRAFT_166742 [Penicilliopsis zonata CBS 506.65]OJJ46498.1 hypothetical protein ASPZODRAFT_166742 [Penicilliopsis zonata CBS 506.65]
MAEHQPPPENTQMKPLLSPEDMMEKKTSVQEEEDVNEESPPPALVGRNLGLLTAGLCLCVFLSALDITIVSTSLTSISNDLDAFEESSWIVSSYLATYFSFLIIWAKLSDFFGRKRMLIGAVVLFLAFSGACGGTKAPMALIVCRAFQGIGGAGIFSMVPIIVAEMVEPARYGAYNGIISLAIAFSFLLGPLFGGAISDGTTWHWIFWINLPVSVVALALVFVSMPAEFGLSKPRDRNVPILNRIDYPGFFMLLASCVLVIVAIEEAGISYAWDSALVIACLVIAGILFLLFIAWQWYLDHTQSQREPIFPWQFVKTRVLMGIYLNALLSGVPFVTLVIELPLRFMSINGKSGLDSGIAILPFTLALAFGSAITGSITSKGRVPVIAVLFAATLFQILGMGLLYSVAVTAHLPASIYGYQFLAGLGTGLSLTTLLNVVPSVVDRRVLAVAMGGVTQLRILGGALGTSIATNLLNTTAKSRLATELPADTLARILKDVSLVQTLSSADQTMVHAAFAQGYHKQLAMMLGFCAAEVVALALIWEWPMRRLE